MVSAPPWQPTCAIAKPTFTALRRRAIFECCKWDPQVGDVSVLAPYPIVLPAAEWEQLARAAESLAAETEALESALLVAPRLQRRLGLPRAVRRVLARAADGGAAAGVARVLRFDFHFTADGWRISEVNSDVPGGFIEAAGFTELVAAEFPALRPAGDPVAAIMQALQRATGPGRHIGLLHATAYTDDRQVMHYFARRLAAVGFDAVLLSPADLVWRAGEAAVAAGPHAAPLDALLRFYPAEWLPNLPRRCGWPQLFVGGRTPQANPAVALLTQSKRLPLVWDELPVAIPGWRRFLPETRDPRQADWRRDPRWILKPALGRVGEAIGMHGVTTPAVWRRIRRSVFWAGRHWVAQRRFDTLPMTTPEGPMYVCIGVFVVDGWAAGAYGRLARQPLIDQHAREAAVLIAPARPAPSRACEHDYAAAGAV